MNSILKLDFNERSDSPSAVAEQYAYGEPLWRYPERQSLEANLANLNGLEPEQLLCTNGGDEAIMLLMRLASEGRQLILPLPAFSQYTWGISSWQLDAKQIPAKSDLSLDFASTLNCVSQTSQAIVVITSPNNPSGEEINEQDLRAILTAAKAKQSWVFLDEAYIEFSEQKSYTNLLAEFDNLVILRTLSKAYGLAGVRLGYLMGNKKLIELFKQRCIPFNVPQPSIDIATKAIIKNNRLEVQSYCQRIKENRAILVSLLVQWKIKVLPSGGNFLLLNLPAKQAKAVQSFLAKKDILVRGFSEPLLQNCLRVTIPYRLERLVNVLRQTLAPQLICLDMDGVLIDTSASYDTTIKATVVKLGGQAISDKAIFELKDSGGYNNDWLVAQALLDEQNIQVDLEKVTDVFQKLYLGDSNDGLITNEKALINSSLVKQIKNSQNCQFAIVTGRPAFEAELGKTLIGLSQLPSLGMDQVKQPKPSPEGIEKLQCQYSKLSWMCGDNPDDMQAANASNSFAIGIGKRNAKALYQAGADIVLDDINQLQSWL